MSRARWALVLVLVTGCGPSLSHADASVPDAGLSLDGGGDGGLVSTTPMGATVGPGGVTFRLWAPHARAVSVTGDFAASPVPLASEDGGVFSATVPAAHVGSAYAFVLDTPSGTYSRLDPYCRQLSSTTRCLVVDPSAFTWSDATWKRPAREGTVVYELHVGSFAVDAGTALGTFASAQARLPELADLGVTTIELMPAMDFGGRNGWGYNPQLDLAPQPAFGTADELRAFVDAAHTQGLAVWLDVVVNHMDGWRQAPLACFDDGCPDGGWGPYFFEAGPYATTPWGPRPDYTEPHVAQMLLDSAREWLGEFHGDGFRWDSVSNIRALDGAGTTPGGRELLVAANALTHRAGALSVAEDLKGFADITTPPSTGGFGFDAQWDGFGYDVMNQLSLSQDDARDLGVVQNALQGGYAGDGFARLLFVEDHDTVGNGGARLPVRIDAASPESFAARRRAMLGAVLLLTSPGVPMLFMGQESLATQGFASPPAPLQAPTAHGLEVRAFYKDLIALRRNRAGTTASLGESEVDVLHRNDANKVLAWRRHGPSGQDVIVLMNLKNKAYTGYDIGVPAAGAWQVRLDTDWLAYGADFTGGQQGALTALAQTYDGQPAKLTVKLGAYGAVVLSR